MYFSLFPTNKLSCDEYELDFKGWEELNDQNIEL